jgi:hypothetical protein
MIQMRYGSRILVKKFQGREHLRDLDAEGRML